MQKLSQYNLIIEWRAGTDPLMSPSDAMTRLTKLIKAPVADQPTADKPSPNYGMDPLEKGAYKRPQIRISFTHMSAAPLP
eukprot:COSAG01_NODE_27448_length_685_cov_1.919795_2_plen_80_part_00